MGKYGRQIKECRMCNCDEFYNFLDMGFAPASDSLLREETLNEPEILFPLKIIQCKNCGLTQLSYAANPNILYDEKYLYESSITKTGTNHFLSMADSICKKFELKSDDLAVDIGSNVGVLLSGFKNNGVKVLGIDPAPKIVEIANNRGIETWKSLFDENVVKKIVSEKGKAKVITATNVFAHIDDKKELMSGISSLIEDDGIFVVEAPYLVDLIEELEYDTIYIEHLEYLSIKPLVQFFKRYGMDLFDVERYNIHGKTIRFFVCKEGKYEISKAVEELINIENEKQIYSKDTLDEMRKKVEQHKKEFVDLLLKLKSGGKNIVGISAPAKGNTLLNYCKIGPEIIDHMTEKSIIKQGCYTPGMHIPIVSEDEDSYNGIDYGIIFAWNFAEEIIKNNKEFSEKGGKFIVPVSKDGIKII